MDSRIATRKRAGVPVVRAARFGESALLLLDVVEVLERNGVAYAVIGAVAALATLSP